jgi:gliding motility-associated-like protein
MKKAFLIIVVLLTSFGSFASHIPGGNISYQCTGNPNEYLITFTSFVSCPSSLGTAATVQANNTCGFPSQAIALTSPPGVEVSQICPAQQSQSDCPPGTGGIPGVLMYTYTGLVTLGGPCDTWTFSFELCCRDASANMSGTTGNSFYVQSTMNSVTASCDGSPYVTAQPIPYVCAGQQQTYCPGAIDPDGDSLYYALVNPLGAAAAPIIHLAGYTPTAPLTGLVMDPVTGCITFNEPSIGNFVVTYLIEAYDGNGNVTGSIIHDFQFEVINNVNCQPPTPAPTGVSNPTGSGIVLNGNTVEICEGQSFCFDITFTDLDTLDILQLDSSNTNIFTTMPGVIVTQTGANPTTFNICWTVPVGASPNTQASIGVTDGSCPIENLASFPLVINVINSTVVNNPIVICGTQTAQLSAAGGSVFTWYYTATGLQVPVGPEFSCNPCSNPVATPSAMGTTQYYVVSDLSVGCNPSDSTSVTVVPDFTPTAYGDTLLCDFLPHQIGMNVNPGGAGYNTVWTPGATLNNPVSMTPIANATETTTYTGIVTSPLGCTKIDSVTIIVNPPPSVTLVPGDTTICQGQTLQFDVSLTAIEDDFTGAFDPAVWNTVSGASVGTPCVPFNGDAMNFDAATRELITNTANVASCTSIDFCMWVANDVLLGAAPCENADAGEDIELSYSTSGPGGPWVSIQIIPTGDWDAAGPYANSWQCFSIPIPAGALTANTTFKWGQIGTYGGTIDNWSIDDIAISCGGNTNYTYGWSPATDLSNDTINNPVFTGTTIGSTLYTVTLTDSGGCSVDRTQTITVAPSFTIALSQSAANTCLFDPVQLDVTVNPGGAGYTYLWTPSTFLDSDSIANPLATITTPGTHTYIVTVTGPGGCMKTDSITVVISNSIAPTFTLTAADSMIFCGQQTLFTITPDTLAVAGAIDDFNGAVINPASWCSVINGSVNTNCGSVTGSALHFDGSTTPREAITIPMNVTSCTSIEFSLFMGNAASGGAPCENADGGEDVELWYSTVGCAGPWILIQLFDSDDWDAAGPYNNAWQNFSIAIPPGAQTPATYFKWDQGTFSACAGCDNWSIDDIAITCPSTSTNYNYSWTPSTSLDNDTLQNPTASPSSTTTYIVTVTDPNGGCTSTDSVTLYVECGTCYPVAPTVTNVTCKDGTDGMISVVPNFVFASEVQTLTWTDSISGAVLQVTPNLTAGMTDTLFNLSAGAYTISMQDTSGCVADTTIWITEPDSVIISSITSNNTICIGGSINLDATATDGNGGPYTFTWTDLNTGTNIPGPNPISVSPTDTLTCYSVFATDALGCISSPDTVCISLFDSITAVPVIAGPIVDTLELCSGDNGGLGMTASGGNGGPYTFEWWESGNLISTNQFETVTPTSNLTTYTGYAYDNCGSPRGVVTIYLVWYGIVIPDIIRSRPDTCYPYSVIFTDASTPSNLVDNNLTQWSISNGGSGTGSSVTGTFDTPFCQDVTLNITTIDGCFADTTFEDYVCPWDYPNADFYMSPSVTDLLNTEIEFTNLSTGIDLTYLWNFNSGLNPDSSTVVHPTFVFPSNVPGTYPVLLTVTSNPYNSQYGCVSTHVETLVINPTYLFYVPNSFTPGGDGLNDVFRAYGDGVDTDNFRMTIFDRWGEKIFSSEDITIGWDGTYKGTPVPNGVYIWRIDTKELNQNKYHENYGNVTIVK